MPNSPYHITITPGHSLHIQFDGCPGCIDIVYPSGGIATVTILQDSSDPETYAFAGQVKEAVHGEHPADRESQGGV